ncbi:DUF3040 domain-containing protein [Corynebacterium sp.]|uniref:DUF3040 domain-containing protein n=1 Tax=Corynebacterium sp. TaxID=1720 RepID=UPI002A917577|nr:DUF3040 domain-containing protein [Corynebacterium sp.]MDY5786097.1 DUF3040 domain-containing protein [Corynebacterium sp.]
MSLSEQEQRALREIEQSLLAEDPSFARSIPRSSAPSGGAGLGRLTLRSVALMVLGLTFLIGGVALAAINMWFIALSVVGFGVMLAGGVMALRSPSPQTSSQSKPRPAAASPKTSKMEENFRRRFEGQ